MKQIAADFIVIVFYLWVVISGVLIIARGGSWFEEGKNGYGIIWKYAPPLWRKITLWAVPPLIAAVILWWIL